MASTLDELNESSEKRPYFTVSQLWTDTLGRLGVRSLQLLIVGTLVGLVILALLNLTVVVIPALIAVILACALWPLVRLCRRVMPNVLAAWTVFLGSLLILGGIGTALVFSVINEWSTLVEQAVEGFNQLREGAEQLLGGLAFVIDQDQIDSMLATVTGFLTSAEFGTGAVTTISAAGTFVTSLVLLLVILFFLLKDGDRIWAFFVSWAPDHFRAQTIASGDRAMHTFGGYIRGTAIVAAADAIGITTALLILQVPLAIPLGVVVFLGGFIPLVGATIAGILATLVALVANGPVVALIVLGAVILVNQLEGNFLQPVVMAQTLSLHALVILMALTAGTVLAGIIGAVLAVPLVAVAWSVIKVWTGREEIEGLGPVDKAQLQIEAVGDERRHQLREAKRQEQAEKAAAKATKSSDDMESDDDNA
ncbi:AI-2E family transporter [Enteractinococcus coprophilus]|uniref:Putative PurR-regulated permease PerM n=1 Tax=Enteractinococcus coprophilus TaxID=1027633 RepID=A0A543AIH5_9MICC|nr:AI-2E family transporter [Enteractinococcus coprophilus]TQL72379.1 putative PurR-regulated permease PerM [Enteractinococcus coprophilus]